MNEGLALSGHLSGGATDILETMLLIDGHTALSFSLPSRLPRGGKAPGRIPVFLDVRRRERSVMSGPAALGRMSAALRPA